MSEAGDVFGRHAAERIDKLAAGTYDSKTATHAIIGQGIIYALLAIVAEIRNASAR